MEELAKAFSSFESVPPFYFWAGGALIIFLIFFPALRNKINLRWDRGYWIKKVPGLKTKKHWILFILIGLISLLIAAAIANPQMVVKRSIPQYGKPVMILIDISGSINPGDSRPEFFSAFREAKNVYYDIIRYETGATIGLSFYSDHHYIARDFAEKLEFLEDTIENSDELQEISQGTKTAEALYRTRVYFSEKVRAKDKTIILISDLDDDYNPIARQMSGILEDGINLYVIAVTEKFPQANQSIQALKSRVGDSRVKMIWYKEADGINKICEEISRMESSITGEAEILSRKSLLPFILPAILGLMIASFILSETIFRKIP